MFPALRGRGPVGAFAIVRGRVMGALWKRGYRTVNDLAADIGAYKGAVRQACRALVDLGLAGTLTGRPIRFWLLRETVEALKAEPWL
jgi:predicted ArsR family transcriptional regulator